MQQMNEKKQALLDSLKGGLIVSCQVQHDDPIYTDKMVVKMAEAAKWGGAVGIRANTPEQIRAIKAAVDLPMIGLYKQWSDNTDVFITPTMQACEEVWQAGAEIIALDCTFQINKDGKRACELLPELKAKIPEAIILADISNYDEAKNAVEQGADIVAPSLYGYTKETQNIEGANYREFAEICRDFSDKAYIVMEGHIYTPEDAMKAIFLGAHAVVVGSAITRPHLITKRFSDLLNKFTSNWRDAEKAKH